MIPACIIQNRFLLQPLALYPVYTGALWNSFGYFMSGPQPMVFQKGPELLWAKVHMLQLKPISRCSLLGQTALDHTDNSPLWSAGSSCLPGVTELLQSGGFYQSTLLIKVVLSSSLEKLA